jgi:hypothetical protein
VDKGGLLITVVVSKTSIQGEPLAISVEMKNTLKREVRLYASTSRWDWRFEPLEGPKGYWGFRPQFAEDRVISGTIQPGKSVVTVFTTRSKRGQEYTFAWTDVGKPLERGATDLPVGRYRLTVGMKLSTFSRPTKEPEPWEGELTTKPVEFKVVGPEEIGEFPINSLISDLSSEAGAKRVAASAEILRRGKVVLPDLKKAGAKQLAPAGGTLHTRRLDMVYSAMEGFPPDLPGTQVGYLTDAFGLYVEKGTTEEEILAMSKKYGCKLDGKLNLEGRPSIKFGIGKGQSLERVIQQVLANEPKVITINLYYIERTIK